MKQLMEDYKEFTFGWLIFVFVIPIQLLLTYLYISHAGDKPIGTIHYIVVTAAFALISLLFYGLTTKLTLNTLTISFGIGLIRKRIQLRKVREVYAVKTPWYYGWGIKIIPNGWLYNMSGRDGVELKFTDTNRIIRIGTRDSLKLKKEIEKRLV